MHAVCNKNRVLAQMQCRDKEQNYLPGAPFSLLVLNKLNDNSGLDYLSGPLLGALGHFAIFDK